MPFPSGAYRASTLLATLLIGLMAGFFFAFWVDVAPAMSHLEAQSYIATQQWINKVVRNIPFGITYFGSTFFAAVPVLFALAHRQWRLAAAWAVLAVVYFAGVFWFTRNVNIPINEAMALWNPAAPPTDWAIQRDVWNVANAQRTAVAFGCFVAALVLMAFPSLGARHAPANA
ncbi:MAG: anthrone oxygenase family protein [Rhizobacter sp.]